MQVNGWTLTCDFSGEPVEVGQDFKDFRGEDHVVKGGTPPHKPGSTGRVSTDQGEFFPSVCNLTWHKD